MYLFSTSQRYLENKSKPLQLQVYIGNEVEEYAVAGFNQGFMHQQIYKLQVLGS